jgi:hypothetical protein
MAGTSSWSTLFQRNLPTKSSTANRIRTVMRDTIAMRAGDAPPDWFSNVSVWEKAAFKPFATTPPNMFLQGESIKFYDSPEYIGKLISFFIHINYTLKLYKLTL